MNLSRKLRMIRYPCRMSFFRRNGWTYALSNSDWNGDSWHFTDLCMRSPWSLARRIQETLTEKKKTSSREGMTPEFPAKQGWNPLQFTTLPEKKTDQDPQKESTNFQSLSSVSSVSSSSSSSSSSSFYRGQMAVNSWGGTKFEEWTSVEVVQVRKEVDSYENPQATFLLVFIWFGNSVENVTPVE